MKHYEPDLLSNGGKMVIMMNLLHEAIQIGEKTLVFRQVAHEYR